MAEASFLKTLKDGSAPRQLRIVAARGLAPLPPREMLELLVCLTDDPDPEIGTRAAQTLKSLPEEETIDQVQARDCDPGILEYFAAAGAPDAILEAISMNPSTQASVVAKMALTSPAPVLETIIYNRVRLLECPEILQNLKLNPSITGEIRRLVQEIEAEFFSSRKNQYTIEESTVTDTPTPQTASLEAEPVPDDLSLEGLPLDPEEREAAILQRLARMTVPQKVRYARLGTREARAILIRDPNKEVARTVLQSPKLSESEVEAFAAMRSVSDEVLRQIGNSKEWTRSYGIIHNLVKNPKTPPMISQRILFRLQSRDLTLLARDRAVPEVVRRNAQRTLSQRLTSSSAR